METGSVSIFFLIYLLNTMVAVCKRLGWGKSHILVSNKVKVSESIMHTVTIVLSKKPNSGSLQIHCFARRDICT